MRKIPGKPTSGAVPGLLIVWLLFFSLPLVGCTPPTEQAERYYQNGMALLLEKKPAKATLEFQNSLQIVDSMPMATYGLALAAEQQEDWRKMFRLLNEFLEAEPGHWKAQLKRGQLLLAGSDIDAAFEASNITLHLAPEEAEVLAFRAAVFFKLGKPDEAEGFALAALALAPGNVEASTIMANELVAVGQFREAIAYLDQALQYAPEHIGLSLLKIESLEKINKIEDARTIYEELLIANPDLYGLGRSLAAFYARNGLMDKAETTLRVLATESSTNLEAKLDLVQFVGSRNGFEAAHAELNTYIQQSPEQADLQYALVDLHRRSNKTSEAKALLLNIITRFEGTPEVLKAKEQLAGLEFSDGDRTKASQLIDEILAEEPRSQQGLFLRAAMAVERRQLDEAASDLRVLLMDAPDSARALLLLGITHKLSGSPELAEGQYQRAFIASERSPRYAAAFAKYLVEEGRDARAGQVLKEALLVTPDSPELIEALAKHKLSLGDLAGATEAADRLILAGGPRISAAYRIIGAVHMEKNEYDKGIQAYNKAHRISPQSREILSALIEVYIAANREEEAMEFLNLKLRSGSSESSVLLLIGKLHLRNANNSEALKNFEAAIDIEPSHPSAYLALSSLHLREERVLDASQTLSRGLERIPANVELRLAQADIYKRMDQFDDAIKSYELVLASQPNSNIAANNLSSLLSEHKKDERNLNRAYELAQRFNRSKTPHFRDTLGWIYYQRGLHSQAVALLEDVVAQAPEVPIFRYHLGMSYMAINNPERARQELETALEMTATVEFPYSDAAEAALVKLASLPKEG